MQQPLTAVLIAALALAPPALAQSKPDFSGTWVMDASRSQSAVQNEPVKSMTLVIAQNPNELSIETKRDERVQTVMYKAGSPNTMNTNTGRKGLIAATWYWDGTKIVTETISDVNGATVRNKAIYTLDTAATELTVESLMVVEHGYTLRGSQNYGSGKDVFKKAP